MKFEVPGLDLKTLKVDRACLALGAKGSGKTTLMMNLIQHYADKVDMGIAMTPSVDVMKDLHKHFPKPLVHSNFNDTQLQSVVDHQMAEDAAGRPMRKILLVLDDLTYNPKIWKMEIIRNLLMNGRHLGFTIIMTSQYITDLPPNLRANIDYLFTFKDSSTDNQKKLHKYFFGGFENFKDFRKTFLACTQDFECIVLDKVCGSTDVRDNVKYFKAIQDLPSFKVGKKLFFEVANYCRRSQLANTTMTSANKAAGAISSDMVNITEVSKGKLKKQKGLKKPSRSSKSSAPEIFIDNI